MKKIFLIGAALFAVVVLAGCGDPKPSGAGSPSGKPEAAKPTQVLERFEGVTVKLNSPAFGMLTGLTALRPPKQDRP